MNIYLHMDNKDDDCVEIDFLSIASFMGKKKKLYAYVLALAVLVGVRLQTVLDTVESVNLVTLSSYIESHNLTKDKDRLSEYYEYRIKQYNMELSEYQVQLSNIQTTIANYQKDQVVIVSSQETTQEIEQTSEYYDSLLSQKLEISAQIASLAETIPSLWT